MNRLVAIALLSAISVFAQTNRGSISGTVTDQTGGVIAGASVTVTNLGTNEIRKVTTSDIGAFSVHNLEPVTYRLEAESKGFKKQVVQDIKVDTASNTTGNVTLQAGSVDTAVTVTAE